jgi:hypothetical protein
MTDKIKSVPKGEVKVMAEFKPKKENIRITFREEFDQPELDYLGVVGYSLNGPFLIVVMEDDKQDIYQINTIFKIQTYVTQE